ncbi:hypothetical protein FRX31_017400 [Thalictrum thalictroides]|uniref:Uncharacterized protein n=1 Tax=Thalictrum thalictroides TaxID=46969 RepID=A0A7J6W9E9_THATH|nr:hypothetical protein FRX31_017400 [Thalictrum thalictroides]
MLLAMQLREEERVLPPPYTAAPGRPKTVRIKGDDEEPSSNRRCTICKEPNHNARTCKARKLQKDKEEAAKLKKQKTTGAPTQQKKTRDYVELTVQHTKKKQRKEISCPIRTTPTSRTSPTHNSNSKNNSNSQYS